MQRKIENLYNLTMNIFSKKNREVNEPVNIKMLSIATNWACDARCEICDIWKKDHKTMMKPSLLNSSLQSPFFNNVTCVGFFGGEPTLHPELPELMKIIKDRFGIDASIVSNGYGKQIPQVLINLKNLDFNPLICVSIDGNKSIHDKRRGREGIYDNALRTLALANQLFAQKPRISFTVLPETVDQLPHIFELAKEHNTDISMRPGVSGSYFGGKANENWNELQIDKLENYISKMPDNLLANPLFVRDIPEFLRTGTTKKECKAAYVILVVDPDMKTRICHSLPPICDLVDVPNKWGKDEKWKAAKNGKCFKRECFIDGPYSVN